MENKKYENAVSIEIAKKLKDGFIEITIPEDKAEILSRILAPTSVANLDNKNIDELFNSARVISGVIFEDPRPEQKRVYVDRVVYYPNADYDRIMEDAHEYSPNQDVRVSQFNTNAEVFTTQIDSGELKTEELNKIKKSPSYSYYIKHANDNQSQPGEQE